MRKRFLEGFHYDAHPMGMLVSAIAALSTFYPEAGDVHDPENRYKQITRLIAKMPTLAAACHRFSVGMPFVYPDNSLGFTENFLSMLWKIAEPRYDANPALARALDVLFILHADHEQNCGTTAMRTVGSAHADAYMSTASAAAALYGPRHGGANEDVIHMLTEIGTIDQIPAFVESVKQGERRMPGVRPPRVQELRPARHDHQGDRRRGVRDHGQEPAARHRPRPRRRRALRRLLHLAASSTRTSTSTRGSSTRPWASRWRCSRCCSRSPAPPGGWRTGWSSSSRTRRSPARASSTSDPRVRDYVAMGERG